jgi:hypothetical protein
MEVMASSYNARAGMAIDELGNWQHFASGGADQYLGPPIKKYAPPHGVDLKQRRGSFLIRLLETAGQ